MVDVGGGGAKMRVSGTLSLSAKGQRLQRSWAVAGGSGREWCICFFVFFEKVDVLFERGRENTKVMLAFLVFVFFVDLEKTCTLLAFLPMFGN